MKENKVLSSFDLGQDTYPVDLAILGGNKKLFTICIGSSDGKVSLFTLSGKISKISFGTFVCSTFVCSTFVHVC